MRVTRVCPNRRSAAHGISDQELREAGTQACGVHYGWAAPAIEIAPAAPMSACADTESARLSGWFEMAGLARDWFLVSLRDRDACAERSVNLIRATLSSGSYSG